MMNVGSWRGSSCQRAALLVGAVCALHVGGCKQAAGTTDGDPVASDCDSGVLKPGSAVECEIADGKTARGLTIAGMSGKGGLEIKVEHRDGSDAILVQIGGEGFSVDPAKTDSVTVGTKDMTTMYKVALSSASKASFRITARFVEELYEHELNDRCDSGNVCEGLVVESLHYGRIKDMEDRDLYRIQGIDGAGSLHIEVENLGSDPAGTDLLVVVGGESFTIPAGAEGALDVGNTVSQTHTLALSAMKGIAPYRLLVRFEDAVFEHENNARCDSGNVCETLVVGIDHFARIKDGADQDQYRIAGEDGAGSLHVLVQDLREELENEVELAVAIGSESFAVPAGGSNELSVGTKVNAHQHIVVSAKEGIVPYRLHATFEDSAFEHEPNHRCDSGNVCDRLEAGDEMLGRVKDGSDSDQFMASGPADSTSATFTIEALDDGVLDGVLSVKVGSMTIEIPRGTTQSITGEGKNVAAILSASAGPVPYRIAVAF